MTGSPEGTGTQEPPSEPKRCTYPVFCPANFYNAHSPPHQQEEPLGPGNGFDDVPGTVSKVSTGLGGYAPECSESQGNGDLPRVARAPPYPAASGAQL